MAYKKTILLDFDAVLHQYTGWKGSEERFLSPPIPNARHACHILARDRRLVCFTTRQETEVIERWLRANGFPEMKVTDRKEAASVQLDDRAIRFDGVWTDALIKELLEFKPYWEGSDSQSLHSVDALDLTQPE